MHGGSNMETYNTICKIDSQREFAVWLKKLKQGLSINLEGWDGERDGREVQKGGWFMLRFDSKQQNSVKQFYPSIKKNKIYTLSNSFKQYLSGAADWSHWQVVYKLSLGNYLAGAELAKRKGF